MAFLPEDIWRRRLDSEYRQVQASGVAFSCNTDKTEYEISINGKGYCLDGGSLVPRMEHSVRITLLRNYPYAGGIDVVWLTPIFHPNIRANDGKVCIQLLNNWGATQGITSLVEGLKQLLEHPNPADPLDPEAAAYFASGKLLTKEYSARPGAPRIVG